MDNCGRVLEESACPKACGNDCILSSRVLALVSFEKSCQHQFPHCISAVSDSTGGSSSFIRFSSQGVFLCCPSQAFASQLFQTQEAHHMPTGWFFKRLGHGFEDLLESED